MITFLSAVLKLPAEEFEGIEKVAKSLLDVLDEDTISAKTGLSVEFVKGLRK